MTTVAGGRRAPKKRRELDYARLALLGVGVLAAGAAWVVLVRGAIDFGASAKSGESVAWVFLVLATIGAAGCLLLALVLVARALVMTGVITDYKPKRARRS